MKKPNEDEKASGSDIAVIKREDRKIVLIQTLNSSCFFLKNSCWASDSSSSTHSMKSGVSGCTHKECITRFIRALDPDPAFQVNPDPDPGF